MLTLHGKMAEQGGWEDAFSFKAKADTFLDFEKIQVAIGEANEHLISCLRCKSKILKPQEGTLVEKEYFIPNPTAKGDQSATEEPDGETLNKHWLVKDIMDFENIGFTYVRGTIRYLACADCEVGPVGWHDITNKKEYYLTATRVQYSDK